MPAPVLHLGATVTCSHAAPAQPTTPFPRVLVSAQPVTTISTPYVVTGCPFAPGAPSPCAAGQWVTGAVRVLAGGAPLATMTGGSTCVPNGTPMLPLVAQTRVVVT